jgi:lantibiotic modifying enzyme
MLLRLHRLYRHYPIAARIAKLAAFIFALLKDQAEALRDEKTLLGFAHGTAGVSAVLAEYMRYFELHDPDAQALIQRNVARETSYRTAQGWPRLSDEGLSYATSWCHGTVGIGFSRLHSRPFMPAEVYAADMDIIRARLGEAQPSLCLCHGMLADYWLAQALGLETTEMLRRIRQATEQHGLTTSYGLNGFEVIGAMDGVCSLLTGEAIFLNKC